MPVFVEDPAQFSKQRLKLELVANNVVLPPGESKKQVYLDLYMKYVSTKRAADFSSDEEDQVQGNDAEDPAVQEDSEEEGQQDLEKMDVTELTDEELKARLLQFGVKAGPIVASTRALYERKLQRLLDTDALPNQNGNNDAVLYSDSDEDEDEEEEGEDDPGAEPAPQGPEPVAVVTGSRHSQLESKQVGRRSRGSARYYYPQCFALPSRMAVSLFTAPPSPASSIPLPAASSASSILTASSTSSPASSGFSISQMVEELESRSLRLSSRAAPQSPGDREASRRCETQSPGDREPEASSAQGVTWADKGTMTSLGGSPPATVGSVFPPQTPTADVLNEMFPDAERTPTGISATRRRPIKGAAGRPVQFKYPDTPLSPASLERRDLHQRLVPMWLQALVFLGVAGVLYLVFGAMNEGMESPFAMLPGILSEGVELAEEPAS